MKINKVEPSQGEGFYKVKSFDVWTVMYWDGDGWFDHTSGQYASYNNCDSITEIRKKIDLPEEQQ